MKKLNKLFVIASLIVVIATISFISCNDNNNEIKEKKEYNLNKAGTINDSLVSYIMRTDEIRFNFDIDSVMDSLNTQLSHYNRNLECTAIYLKDDNPIRDTSAFLCVQIYNISTNVTANIFIGLHKEYNDTIVNYYTDTETRTIVCTATGCKNENGCSADIKKNDCTPCDGGSCTKTDTYSKTDTGSSITWAVVITWAITILVAFL